MPIPTSFLEQLVFLSLNLGPAPILDIWGAAGFRIVLAAVRLGVFEALADGPLASEALVQRLQTDPRGTALLINALESLGYLRQQAGGYANSAMTSKWLLRRSGNFGPGFEFWGTNLFKLWDSLEDSLRTGQPALNLYTWIEDQPEVSRAFQEWMVALAGFTSGEVLRLVRLPAGARRLLDIGGGHAAYSIAFCRQYPDLAATVFDQPQALNTARANVTEAGLLDRITLQAGDFLGEVLGEGYDVALLFNIVHGFSDEQDRALVNRAAQALRPGGLLVLAEQLAGGPAGGAAHAIQQILGLSYYHLLEGQLYSYEAVSDWMRSAGLANVRRIDSLRLPGTNLVLGCRAA
jgi:predicted O-methyltransferase YrrM